jgi:hypothetical protein
MAAGCEATKQEDRDWVKKRWELMSSRMKLGIIEKCLEVTKEVWCRRDAYSAERVSLETSRNDMFSMKTPIKRDFDTFFDDLQADNDSQWLNNASKRRAVDSASYTISNQYSTVPARPITRQNSTDDTELLEPQYTVKGRLHWLGVMKDWEWESKSQYPPPACTHD